MFAPLLLLIPVVLVTQTPASPTGGCWFGRTGDPVLDARAVAAFSVAVERYADLHRRLERSLPPEWLMADMEQMDIAALHLAAAIREARPAAGTGSIFTSEVADVFRVRIANAIREQNYDPAAMVTAGEDEAWTSRGRPVVNEPLPWELPTSVWPSITAALPRLPAELEYRFTGRDLVLLDVHADLVVDILELALPTSAPRDAVEAFR